MGTVYLNAICAQKTLGAVKDESFRDLAARCRGAYYLGSIAEELFCFFDCFSKEENTWIRDIASQLKNEGIALFDDIKKYIGKAPAADRDVLKAYLAGMAADYTCDYRIGGYLDTVIPAGGSRTRRNEAAVKLECCLLKDTKDPVDLKGALEGLTADQTLAIERMYAAVIGEKRRQIIPDGIIADCVAKLIKALGQKKSILPIPRPGKEFCWAPADDRDGILNSDHRKWTDRGGETANYSLQEMIGYAARDASGIVVKLTQAADRAIPTESCEFLFRKLN
ncbi:MAG: hypothetical protein IKD81_08305 [Eubacteriaceae bacterium]|nr:hypothetical protein [Eubacteriaceae bacterium]